MSGMPSRARVVQINVNPRGGVPKHRVASTDVTANGVVGDKQRDKRYHGGPTRAVSLYSYERIEALRRCWSTLQMSIPRLVGTDSQRPSGLSNP